MVDGKINRTPRRVLTGPEGTAARRADEFSRRNEERIAELELRPNGAVDSVTAGTGLTGGGTGAVILAADFGTGAGKVTQGNDARLSDARTPTGAAGGDLSGTYPNPSVQLLGTAGASVDVKGAAVPVAGQVLRASDATHATWQYVSGPSGIWIPDAPNPSPHADDQEFDGSWAPSGWSEFDPNTLVVPTQADGFLLLTNTANGTNQIRGAYRNCPADAEWFIWTRVSTTGFLGGTAQNNQGGIFISDGVNTSTSKFFTCLAQAYDSAFLTFGARTYTTYNSGAAVSGQSGPGAGNGGYVGIGYDGTSFTAWACWDGVSWMRLTSIAKSFTPTLAGLYHNNQSSSATQYCRFDFYRVHAASGAMSQTAGLNRGARL